MDNQERIQKWREERLLLAEQEKLERARRAQEQSAARAAQAKTAREEEARLEDVRRREVAESLLPTPASVVAEQEAALERRHAQAIRRRRRLFAFVGLPTLLVALYAIFFATPFYEAEATFTIATINDNGPPPAVGLLGASTGMGTLSDGYRVREFLLSRQAMAEMERLFGFVSHFEEGSVDPLSRPIVIPALGLDRHDYYQRRVRISVDLQQGLIKLKVQALSAAAAADFANALLDLGKDKVAAISDRLNADQIEALEQNLGQAEADVRRAAARVAQVQRLRADVDPQQTTANVYQIISNLEVQLAEAENERSGLLANGLTESPLLPRLNARIAALDQQIAEQKGRLVGSGGRSVQRALIDLETTTAQKKLADSSLESVLRTLEAARLRALEQRRYLVVVAEPVPPATASISRAPYIIVLAAVLALLGYGLVTILRRVRQLRTV